MNFTGAVLIVSGGAVARSPFFWDGNEITLSCSIGMHEFHGQQSADEALSQADASMYQAKRQHYKEKNGDSAGAEDGTEDAAEE